ncbi:MAG: hypothetical protein H0T73_09535, partial [Ardenticatenales bacterium]|nr:hypothetical protein [Ardenticatenales bacterium]
MPSFKKLSASDLGSSIASDSALTEADIAAWVGSTNMGRARGYDNLRTLLIPTRTGQTIKAFCQGSMP